MISTLSNIERLMNIAKQTVEEKGMGISDIQSSVRSHRTSESFAKVYQQHHNRYPDFEARNLPQGQIDENPFTPAQKEINDE